MAKKSNGKPTKEQEKIKELEKKLNAAAKTALDASQGEDDEDEDETELNTADEVQADALAMYDMKQALTAAGIGEDVERNIILFKKTPDGKYAHVKTYNNEKEINVDTIGKLYRGGDYMVKAHTSNGYVKGTTRLFSVSLDAFPVLPDVPAESSNESRLETLITALISKKDENAPNIQLEIAKMQLDAQAKNNELIIKLIEGRKGGMEQLAEMLAITEKIRGKNNDFDAGTMVKSVLDKTIGFTLDMVENKINRDTRSGFLDKLGDKLGDLVDSVPEILQALPNAAATRQIAGVKVQNPASPDSAAAPATAVPAATAQAGQTAAARFNTLLSYFVAQIIIGFNQKHPAQFLADNVHFLEDFSNLEKLIFAMTNEQIVAQLCLTPTYKTLFETNQGFPEYFGEILDKVREYDNLDTDDEDETNNEAVPPETADTAAQSGTAQAAADTADEANEVVNENTNNGGEK